MGIVPSTNPTSTVMFKSLIALKSRNAIIFSPHPSAKKCTSKAVEIIHKAVAEGAPENIVQCIEMTTMQATNTVMESKEVKLIIATGACHGYMHIVQAKKSSAIGVGAEIHLAYIERTADIKKAVTNIMTSKTFLIMEQFVLQSRQSL